MFASCRCRDVDEPGMGFGIDVLRQVKVYLKDILNVYIYIYV